MQRHAANADAYEHYIRGRYLISKRTREALLEAVACLERAIAIDPRFALAHAGLSEAWIQLGLRAAVSQSLRPREVMPKARAAAEKALALDDSLSEAHGTLGQVLFTYEWKRDAGIARVSARHRSQSQQPERTALVCHGARRPGPVRRSAGADPACPRDRSARGDRQRQLGFLLYRAGRLDEAVAKLRHTVAMEPGFVMTRYRLGLALEAQGRFDEAIAEFRAMNPSAHDPLGLTAIARTLALMQRPDEARRELDQLLQIARTTYVPSALIAGVYIALDDTERALEYLERGVEERAITLLWLPFERYWDRLHGDPRFRRLLENIGLKV